MTTNACDCFSSKHPECVRNEIREERTSCPDCQKEYNYSSSSRTECYCPYSMRQFLNGLRVVFGCMMSILGVFVSGPGIAALIIGYRMTNNDLRSTYMMLSFLIWPVFAMGIFTGWHQSYPPPDRNRDELFWPDMIRYWWVVWIIVILTWCIILIIKLIGWGSRAYILKLETNGYWDPRTFSTGLAMSFMLAACIGLLIGFFYLIYIFRSSFRPTACCCVRDVVDIEIGLNETSDAGLVQK